MLLAFDWTQLAQQIVIGLSSGGVWATLAVALVLIYRSTGVVNFAQGEMAMFSTFIAWSLVHHGLSYWAAFVLTVAISFFGGVGIERVVIKPVERAPVLTVVIVTLGLAPLVVAEIFRIVRELNERDGLAVLVVEQNAALALDASARAYVLEVGRVAVEGDSARLREDVAVRRSYLGY